MEPGIVAEVATITRYHEVNTTNGVLSMTDQAGQARAARICCRIKVHSGKRPGSNSRDPGKIRSEGSTIVSGFNWKGWWVDVDEKRG
jgi:hypothetical protein